VVLVDTTVWIDFLAGRDTPEVRVLERCLDAGGDVCICGVVLTEVLQGIREDADYRRTKARFGHFLFLPAGQGTFVRAAELYRSLRRRGITIRKPVDCMIAAVAIEHDVPLLHSDRDFDPISKYCGLRVIDVDLEGQQSASG
jgi:predicted nucleic acid-binding protein